MIVECFAGPGGWSEGLRLLGRTSDLALEWDADACATARAAGHSREQADVAAYPLADLARHHGAVEGLIMSPPCPTFSTAGQGAGRSVTDELAAACRDAAAGRPLEPHRKLIESRLFVAAIDEGKDTAEATEYAEETAREAMLTCEPARWAHELRPRWIALEQVPPVLPLWEATAAALRDLGYKTWVGILNAADYGVPQTRRRAFLLASLDRQPHPPEPTHAQRPEPTLFGPELRPWVSMAEALHWMSPSDEWRWNGTDSGRSTGYGARPLTGADPAPTLAIGHSRPRVVSGPGEVFVGFPRRDDRGDSDDGYRERDWHDVTDPAPVLTEKARSWTLKDEVGELVVRTGANSMVTGRTADDLQPYERPVTEPAPTVDAKTGSAWKVTSNNTVAGEGRADAQRIPVTDPAPTLDGKGRWFLERPATTVQGDPRVWPPGHKVNGDDETRLGAEEAAERYGDRAGTNAIRIEIADALVLQSFPASYPCDGLAPAPHVAQALSVEANAALAHELVGDDLKRVVHFSVLPLPGEDDEVLQGVVVADSVDVMYDLLALRPGDDTVLWLHRATGVDVPGVIGAGSGELGAALVRVQRITVKPPLLPVLGAESPSHRLTFAVLARRLRWPTGEAELAVPRSGVVQAAHALRENYSLASLDLADLHRTRNYRAAGSTKSSQFRQVGNAVPPLLAARVLAQVIGEPTP